MNTIEIDDKLHEVIRKADVVLNSSMVASYDEKAQLANNAKATALLGLIELKKLEFMQSKS